MEINIIIFVINLWVACDLNKKVEKLETELHYGTYPSESFPDDPRHRARKWYEFCGRI